MTGDRTPMGWAWFEDRHDAQPDPAAANQPRLSRPAGVPEKFWDGETGTVRTDALLKSYLEIERKLGSMITLPADDGDREGHSRLHPALGVPERPEDYQITARSALVEP